MTDGEQTAAFLTSGGVALSAVGAFVKWMFMQWLAERKDERTERKAERDAATNATVQVAVAMNTMALKFDGFSKQLSSVETSVEHVADEITGRHEMPLEHSKVRLQTQPGIAGYRGPKRPRQDT